MSIPGFDDWLATPLGAYLLEREQARYDGMVADVFGYNAVQLGLPRRDLLRANRIPFRVRLDPAGPAELRADFHHLPFASQSVDLVAMPHVLEFSENPHQVLREVERILIPEGQVVLSGFNPWSLWGVRRSKVLPWQGRFLSLPRIKDWFALLGFEIVAGGFCGYVPPVNSERWIERLGFMDKAGDRWWAVAGGVYVLLAKKKVHGMRLILPGWHEKARTRKAFVPAAQKTGESL